MKNEQEIRKDEKAKIAKWLKGLERRLVSEYHRENNPEEKAILKARIGIYEGTADDVLGGAADRAVY